VEFLFKNLRVLRLSQCLRENQTPFLQESSILTGFTGLLFGLRDATLDLVSLIVNGRKRPAILSRIKYCLLYTLKVLNHVPPLTLRERAPLRDLVSQLRDGR
jgi:hypothetical protein